MLKEYLNHVSRINKRPSSEQAGPLSSSASSSLSSPECCLQRVLLIAHKELIGLYSGAGFTLVGRSAVEHGPDPWYEMVFQL